MVDMSLLVAEVASDECMEADTFNIGVFDSNSAEGGFSNGCI